MQEWIRLQYQIEEIQPNDGVSYSPILESEGVTDSVFAPEYIDEIVSEGEMIDGEEMVDVQLEDEVCQDDHIPLSEEKKESGMSSEYRLRMMERTLTEIQKYVETLLIMIRRDLNSNGVTHEAIVHASSSDREQEVIYGVFNGEAFVAEDGEVFAIPPNYASKSRLVQGDTMKLNFGPDGKLLYKQVDPIKRRRIRGVLVQDEDTEAFHVAATEGNFKVLGASVSHYKGVPGDEVILVVPQSGFSHWGAVETIIKKL